MSEATTGVRLSSRDLELLRQLAAGCSTRQTAVALSVSTNTVRTRLRRVRSKLGVADRDQAVRATRELGFL